METQTRDEQSAKKVCPAKMKNILHCLNKGKIILGKVRFSRRICHELARKDEERETKIEQKKDDREGKDAG